MAHELTIRSNGRAEMAFVGETPWHGLGQSITKGASIGVWLKEAGMDWTAKECTPTFKPEGRPMAEIPLDDYKAIYRSDTLAPLSVMGKGYNIVQPQEVLEFFRDLTEQGGWHIHTAGTLKGGRKLWAMASNDSWGQVGKGKKAADEVGLNLLLATSLDGSMKTTAALVATRVVCANTLALAMQENGEQVQISHRTIFDATAVKRALGVAEESFETFMQQAREMAETPIKLEEARMILGKIFLPTKPKVDASWLGSLSELGKSQETDSRAVGDALALFQGAGMGADLATSKGTRWGLFNAVTQMVDHSMGRTDDTRLDSAWFGRGNGFKQQAFELLATA